MGVRKNAKFLTLAEREDFVKACVLMKADIVNPSAPDNQRYSRWDENVGIHWMIQAGFAPGVSSVNFGHGGSGSYSFLSWHRYFLFQFEKQLQAYVPGVMLPYWDWTDPVTIMTDAFLGPSGTGSTNYEVRSGYFARNAPGTPGNPTLPPGWWPVGLEGWLLPTFFPPEAAGALRRNLQSVSELPTANDLREALAKTAYPAFQNVLESGNGLSSFPSQQLHNGLHGWIGGGIGQMGHPAFSPFDPIFYLHHCNIDRLWAMWQMDGHGDEYPATGGRDMHRRNDIMYPWTGGTPGFGTRASISSNIPMPDFSSVGAKRNVDTLDFRAEFGYTYDTLAVVGVGLDGSGSMNALTPDPMTSTAPDVTKWEAAKRGVLAFLQDCETMQRSGITYVMAGIKTFRHIGPDNDFSNMFSVPGYGLVKTGTSFSRAAFSNNIASISPEGSTPLADALQDVQVTLVEPPFAHKPADEQRYLAILTDGLLTSGSPLTSIPDNSFSQTAIFAMGFGTGAEVDYTTLANLVAKGKTIGTPQIFHGENAGTIDKFYTNTLAKAIGFTTMLDPVLELFAGEYAHLDFQVTSGDDVLLITAQGMDYDDSSWSFHLHGPDGVMAFGNGSGHSHSSMHHEGCIPDVTSTRSNGRLTLILQRNNADDACWVGNWHLMVSFKAKDFDAMVMPTFGELILPVSAGPVHGPRFSRLLLSPKARLATRNVTVKSAHRLDDQVLSTNNNDNEACNLVLNIYSRSSLRIEFLSQTDLPTVGSEFHAEIVSDSVIGNVVNSRTFARMVAPLSDTSALVARLKPSQIPKSALLKGSVALKFDPALVLASLEKEDPKLTVMRDEELQVVDHREGILEVHLEDTKVPGTYHVGVFIEGTYCPEHSHSQGGHIHNHGHEKHMEGHDHDKHSEVSVCGPDCCLEGFTRILSTTIPVLAKKQEKGLKKKSRLKKRAK